MLADWFRARKEFFGTSNGGVFFVALFLAAWSAFTISFIKHFVDIAAYRSSTFSWRPVVAEIVEQKIEDWSPPNGDEPRRRLRAIARYQFEGKEHVGPGHGRYPRTASRGDIEHFWATYTKGSSHTLYVNPENPVEGVWRPGFARGEVQQGIIVLGLFGGLVWLAITILRWLRGETQHRIAPDVYRRKMPDGTIEFTWPDNDRYIVIFIPMILGCAICVGLAWLWENQWWYLFVCALPIVAAILGYLIDAKQFWTCKKRLRIDRAKRVQTFQFPSHTELIDVNSFFFRELEKFDDDSDGHTYGAEVGLSRSDGSQLLLARFGTAGLKGVRLRSARLFAKHLAASLGKSLQGLGPVEFREVVLK